MVKRIYIYKGKGKKHKEKKKQKTKKKLLWVFVKLFDKPPFHIQI